MKYFLIVGMSVVSLTGLALAQQVSGKRPGNVAPANEAKNEFGIIDEDAQIEGIVIINGEVSIDGVKVPHGVKKFRSAKSGKTYLIEWGRDNNVSVAEQ